MNYRDALFTIALSLLICPFVFAQTDAESNKWERDAGVIPSYTNQMASLAATSGNSLLSKIIDGDDDTNWISTNPLPSHYISRPDQNILLNSTHFVLVNGQMATNDSLLIDTDLNTNLNIPTDAGEAEVEMTFFNNLSMQYLSVKAAGDQPIDIYGFTTQTDSFLIGTFDPTTEFQLLRYAFPSTSLYKLRLASSASFLLFELAALKGSPVESITVDLGSSVPIGKIYTRHWSGVTNGLPNAERITMSISNDSINWTTIANLIPDALPIIVTDLMEEQNARYIRIAYTIRPVDFNKVFFWEIEVFDENGKFGPMPIAQPSQVSVAELLGVSGIWGWGNNRYSDLLPNGEGPDLYVPTSSHYRNYHNLNWDVLDPDNTPDYVNMAQGNGTEVFFWLNWDREYNEWVATGRDLQVSLQFYQFQDTSWNDPANSAYDIGYNFAAHFGPQQGNGLVSMVEVGNEPWQYDSLTYREILRGMAQGVKAADTIMKVIPCALQASEPNAELDTSPFKNYMGSRITPTAATWLDGINIHNYSYVNQPDGMRKATHPEHVNSVIREVLNAIRFRDQNMPDKEIFCSEWGWEHENADTETCTHDECVSETAAVAYATRGAMMFLRLGVSRATWFFYADTKDTSSLYTRSGLTGSVRTNFTKKRSFVALQSVVNNIGDKKFLYPIQEDDEAWIYVMGDSLSAPTHLIAWRPIEATDTTAITVEVLGNYLPKYACQIDGNDILGTAVPLPRYDKDRFEFDISAIPTIVEIDTCQACPDLLLVNTKILLEGGYDTLTNQLSTTLNQNDLLPTFEIAPSTDDLGERAIKPNVLKSQPITNQVIVELRDSISPNILLASRSALLLENGQVVDFDGFSPVGFYGYPPGNYHIAIRTPNHLSVMTEQAVLLEGWK